MLHIFTADPFSITSGTTVTTTTTTTTTASAAKSAGTIRLEDDLAQKLREAVHKEAKHYADDGSPTAVTRFLKALFAEYGAKPDKVRMAGIYQPLLLLSSYTYYSCYYNCYYSSRFSNISYYYYLRMPLSPYQTITII